MSTRAFLMILLAYLAALPAIAGTDTVWNDRVERGRDPLVEVNGESITRQQLVEVVMRRYARQTLSELVQRMLVEQEARKAGVEVTAEEIDARHQEVRRGVLEEARREAALHGQDPEKLDPDRVFDAWVRRTYLGAEEFHLHLRTGLLSEKVVRQSIAVKDSDLQTLRARIITYTAEKHSEEDAARLAEQVRKRALVGEDFAALAREYSEDEFAANDGWLPAFRVGDVLLPIEPVALTALTKLKPGEITPVVKGRYGCYVLKLESIEDARGMEYLAREELRQRMVRERVQAGLNAWLQKVKARAKIEVRDKRFQ